MTNFSGDSYPTRETRAFPDPEEMTVLHASNVKLDMNAPYYGWDMTSWDLLDWRFTMGGGLVDLMYAITDAATTRGFKLLFFLPGAFDLAPLVRRIRLDHSEVGLMNTYARPTTDFYKPMLIDLLLIKDWDTLVSLGERAQEFTRLYPFVEGQPLAETWVYFLVRPDVLSQWERI